MALISVLNNAPAHLNRPSMVMHIDPQIYVSAFEIEYQAAGRAQLPAESIDLIQAEPDLMEIVDRYGSEVIKQEEDVSFQSTTEQSEGASEPILRAFLIDIPSTEIDPMHAPTVEKPTYRTLILALTPVP